MIEHFNWHDEALATMRREFIAGKSGTEIANLLNAVYHADLSRSAVIGKLFRLGLTRGAYPRAHAAKIVKEAKPPKPAKPVRERLLPVARLQPVKIDRHIPTKTAAVVSSDPKALSHPSFGGCRWPLELFTPGGERMFCCEDRGELKPYCAGHTVRAHTKFQTSDLKKADRELSRQRMAEAVAIGRRGFSFVGNGKQMVAA